MPPSTSLEMVEWELPVGGMNSDASASQIPLGQAALVHNYVTGEPGHLRLRQGMKTAAWIARSTHAATGGYGAAGSPLTQTYYQSATTDLDSDNLVCLGVAVYGDYALVTFGTYGGGNGYRGDYLYGYPNNYPGSTALLSMRTYVLRAPLGVISTTLYEPLGTGMSGTVENKIWEQSLRQADGGAQFPGGPPFPCVYGRGVPFDERVFFVTPTTYGMFGHKLIQSWAGAGGVDVTAAGGTEFPATNGLVHSCSIKVNNGERALDLSNESGGIQTTILKYGLLFRPKLMGAGGVSGTGDSVQPAGYVYKVTPDGFFTQEYGRGALTSVVPNEAPATSATRNFHGWPVQPVINGPYGANAVNEFQGRLFAFAGSRAEVGWQFSWTSGAQGTTKPLYPNIVQWSTGIAEEWPAENYFFIDDASNDVIMGAGTIGDTQLIFTKTNTYVMSGYDESSFQIDPLSRHDGALDGRSVQNIEGRLYWIGNEGLWSWSGSGMPKRESHPRSAVGIRSDLFLQRDKTGDVKYNTLSSVGNVRDRVVFVQQNIQPVNATRAPYTYHPATGSFARWGMSTYSHFVVAPSTTQRQQQPQFFFNFQNRNFVAGSNTVWELTNLFDEVSPSAGEDAPATHTTTDAYRTTADAAGTEDIAGRVQFRDMVVRPGRTVRLKELAVEHAIQHDGTNSALDITLGVDHSQHTLSSTIKTLAARDYDGAGTVEYDNGRYFVDRIIIDGMSISPEAQVFRVRFDKPATSGYRNDGGHKLYRVYAMLEVTRNTRVDSTGA